MHQEKSRATNTHCRKIINCQNSSIDATVRALIGQWHTESHQRVGWIGWTIWVLKNLGNLTNILRCTRAFYVALEIFREELYVTLKSKCGCLGRGFSDRVLSIWVTKEPGTDWRARNLSREKGGGKTRKSEWLHWQGISSLKTGIIKEPAAEW